GVIILDEASSHLDPATAMLFAKAMDKLTTGRTTLIIAHRLATLQHVDDILILERGIVREYGSRASLELDPSSHFFHLLQADLQEAQA
ncbi:MAG TPA: ABC transporter ATP-binding protein, partial [Ktedonobacteraceae bacterium]